MSLFAKKVLRHVLIMCASVAILGITFGVVIHFDPDLHYAANSIIEAVVDILFFPIFLITLFQLLNFTVEKKFLRQIIIICASAAILGVIIGIAGSFDPHINWATGSNPSIDSIIYSGVNAIDLLVLFVCLLFFPTGWVISYQWIQSSPHIRRQPFLRIIGASGVFFFFFASLIGFAIGGLLFVFHH